MSASIVFRAFGHCNVLATHKTTLEVTKDDDITHAGDCIVAVRADFDPVGLSEFARSHKKARIVLACGDLEEVIHADLNSSFSDDREIVVRMGEYLSPRTFAVHADKSAKYLDRGFVKALRAGSHVEVRIEAVE